MKILVYGAGAIGMAFGGFLSRFHEVTLLGRAAHLEAIRRRGLRVQGIWGKHCFRGFRLADSVRSRAVAAGGFDRILLCVKSYDTEAAAHELKKIAGPATAVVSLQNGLGNLETLSRFLPRRQLIGGRVIFGVEVPEPGAIRVTVIANPTALGEASCRNMTARVRQMAADFTRAGLPSTACKNIEGVLWAKVVYNAALNPLASLLGCHYGFLGEHPLTRSLMNDVIAEIYAVTKKSGIPMKPETAGAYQKLFYSHLVPSTYDHHPSMLQDLQCGRRTEIEALNGAVVRAAARLRVPVPVNRYLYRELLRRDHASGRRKRALHAA